MSKDDENSKEEKTPEINNRERMQLLGNKITEAYPNKGFCLMIFGYDSVEKDSNWISNAQRPDMIKALREFADHLESIKLPPNLEN